MSDFDLLNDNQINELYNDVLESGESLLIAKTQCYVIDILECPSTHVINDSCTGARTEYGNFCNNNDASYHYYTYTYYR